MAGCGGEGLPSFDELTSHEHFHLCDTEHSGLQAPPNPTIMTGGHTVFWLSPQTAEYQAILATIATNWFDYTLRSSKRFGCVRS